MIAVLVSLVLFVALGYPFLIAIQPRLNWSSALGASYLFGTSIAALTLLVFSIAGVPWSRPIVGAALLLIWGAACFFIVRRAPAWATGKPRQLQDKYRWPSLVVDGATVLLIAGFTRFATLAAPWEWDFWAIWGLKARTFWFARGVDWAFLTNPDTSTWPFQAHYPPLLPLTLDSVAFVLGRWDDRWLGLVFVGWAVAVILIIRGQLAKELPPTLAAACTLAVAFLAFPRQVGYAEGPLVAFGTAGMLLVRDFTRDGDRRSLTLGALLLGFASITKNEGFILLAAAAFALMITQRNVRVSLTLWPAFVISLIWAFCRFRYNIRGELQPGILARASERLHNMPTLLSYLYHLVPDGTWLWAVLIGLGFVAAKPAARRREQFIVLTAALQLVAYIAAYVVTPRDLQWHVATSWGRLISQAILPLSIAAAAVLAHTISDVSSAASSDIQTI